MGANLPAVIADTHALVWHLIGSDRISQTASNMLREVDAGQRELIIPVVILAELFMIVEKGRVALSVAAFQATVQNWMTATNVLLTPLTPQIIMQSVVHTTIPDIFDRLIVTEARALGVALITRDPVIVGSNLATVIW